MKILTFTSLYPNAVKPNHGIFVETRLRHLLATKEVQARVVAPVPWFPSRHPFFGQYAAYAKVPYQERRSDIHIDYPRYLSVPKLGMSLSPFLMANAVKPIIGRIIDDGFDFDIIDAHYFYPDGVAAVIVGKYFNKPTIITARGSDISFIPKYQFPKKMIQWAAEHASGIICVCNALKNEMIQLGVEPNKIVALRNGVDLQFFQPVDRPVIRQKLRIEGFTILSVGNLVPVKGHDLTIKALVGLPDTRLLIAGSGPEKKKLGDLAKRLGVDNRVTFLGPLDQSILRNYYGATDALVLSSSREGWANVLLESMACGTPVVATNVWGTPEVVNSPNAGLLVQERTPDAIRNAILKLRMNYPKRSDTRKYAEQFDWKSTSSGQIQLFRAALDYNP